MSKIALASFGGAVLALHPKLLGDTVGVASVNQKPGRGDLRPWSQPLEVATAPAGTKAIYRMGRSVADDARYWLVWSKVVHAIHGFISGDATERTFYTGDGPPKQTSNAIGLAARPYPSSWRMLGVPAPKQALRVSARGGSKPPAPKDPDDSEKPADTSEWETRYYTYTYVTDLGEESAPAPVSNEVYCMTDDTLDIMNFAAPPSGAYGINRVRVYRTQSGEAGDADFFFLREEASSIAATIDDNRSLGEGIPTDGWDPPPETLGSLTAMWNGMAAGIDEADGSVRYCVAYKPYAWPVSFETLTPNARAVALAVFGQRLLVLTNGKPVLVAGSGPDSLDEQPLDFLQPCVAPRSAVGMGHGVAWASGDGLVYYGQEGAKLATAGILTKEQWQALNPASMTGAIYAGTYFGSYLDAGGVRRGFFIDPVAPGGIYFLDQGYETMYFDESSNSLYVLDGTRIMKWDAGAALMTAKFRSKVFAGLERNYSAARVEADAYPVTLMVDALDVPAEVVAKRLAARPELFTAPDATTLRWTKTVTDRKPFRLPNEYRTRHWQLELQSRNPVQWLMVASSMRELAEQGADQ